ncbi:MAG: hypothetical protein LIO65_09490 [Odoribacter sp.]|nr:hypothetical protein [Odoribacter sp.]
MKTVILFLSALFCYASIQAQSSKREYRFSNYEANINEVVISTKASTIDIEQTKKDSIIVQATVVVSAKNQAKADEVIQVIDVYEAIEGSFLKVETEFLKDLTLKQIFAGVDLTINYKISIPEDIKLRIINTDGNVFLGDFIGDLNIDLKSCNFRMGNIRTGEMVAQVSNGTFKADYVAKLTGDFKNCPITFDGGKDVKIVASNASISIGSVERLDIRTTGSGVNLGQIEDMTAICSGTKFEIQDIGDVLKMDIKRGEVNVRNIHRDFSNVDIKGSYTKVGLSFQQGAGYNLEIKQNKALKTDIPMDFNLTEKPTSDKNVVVKTGFIGDKKYNGKVLLDLRAGNVFIQ